jgi:hypothetical protein
VRRRLHAARARVRSRAFVCLGAIAIAGLTACQPNDPMADFRWNESVQLASGEVIAMIELQPPSPDFVPWVAPLTPMLLERDAATREWIVVAGADHLSAWEFGGRPCPHVWFFRLRDGAWRLEVLAKELIGRAPNLLVDFSPTRNWEFDAKDFVRQVEKRKKRQLETTSKVPSVMRRIGEQIVGYSREPACDLNAPPTLGEPAGELKRFWKP